MTSSIATDEKSDKKDEVALARGMCAEIEARSEEIEQARCVPFDLIAKLNALGLFAISIPKELGGTERDPMTLIRVIEELAYADSAVGWCGMIYSTTAVLGSYLPNPWAQEIYRVTERAPITGGAAAPSGKGKVVDGGIEVSGRWAWGSGTHHCDWICGGTLVTENGELHKFPNGAPMVHVAFFKKDQVQLHDNWNPSGLRGTGSVDFEVTNQFVPEGRWTLLGGSHRSVDTPLYRFPFFGLFASAVAAVPLGIARRALDDFCDIAQGKIPAFASKTLAKSSITQLEFGRAEALIEGAHRYLLHTIAEVWAKLISGESANVEDKRQLRLAATQATLMSVQAVDILYHLGGGSSVQGDCSLQRHFRDIHVATAHRMVGTDILRTVASIKINQQKPNSQL